MTANSISGYLSELRSALEGSDKAIVRDALSDAEEHLNFAIENMMSNEPEIAREQALRTVIRDYGSPEEIAEAYRDIEAYTRPAWETSRQVKTGNVFARFFGVFADPQAWGALVYMLISLITGVLYFSWAVTGASLSLVFALFIFGLPLAAVFVISVRGIGLLEGRLVEALLGVRMPRRTIFSPPNLTWRERLWAQVKDRQTWTSLAYLVLQLVFGILYFTVFVTLISLALASLAIPVFASFDFPIAFINGQRYYVTPEYFPLAIFTGVILATITMHLARWIGKWHGRYAKVMLVGE